MKSWFKWFSQVGGNATMVFALSLTALVVVVGGGIDFNSAVSGHAQLQDAVDAAVLTGVRASSNNAASASSAFSANVASSIAASASQSYSSGTSSSSNSSGTVNQVTMTGLATVQKPTFMLGLVGINAFSLSASATAVADKASSNPCIYVLDPSSTQSLLVNSGASVTAPNCEIHVKSTGNPAAIFNSGSSLNFKKICIAGANVIRNSVTVPNLSLSCAAQDDPYAGTLPTPSSSSCTYSNLNYNGATVALQPGVYCGWFNFNNSSATVTMAPGVYVIKGGGWNVNGGTWTGSGVTIYYADTSKIQFNSGISANLSAPTSGTYKNILMYEAAGLSKTQFVLNDSVSNQLSGLIWLPSRQLTLNAKSGIQSDSLTMVVWQLILNNTTWNLTQMTGSSGGSVTNIRLIK
ncbi:Tad domain-containing protein [Asticcacaulis solisilvae]|uniref:Tad domain-containing protein n=1 Tax=Asticcacaulis solisilvae TaxID=1217274 RepID=UPI003FD8A650